jgi:LPXTG-motif cell wall-anchored protein
VTADTQAQQDAAKAEKSNTIIYVAVGAVALIAAYYFISKRRR